MAGTLVGKSLADFMSLIKPDGTDRGALFDRATRAGKGRLRRWLKTRDYTSEEIDAIIEHLRNLDFIALMAFLSTNENAQGLARDRLVTVAASKIARREDMRKAGVSAEAIEEFLSALIASGEVKPEHDFKDPELRRKALGAFAGYLGGEFAQLSPERAAQAVELLISGQAFRDLAGVTAQAAKALRRLPAAASAFFSHKAFVAPPRLALGIGRDIWELPEEVGSMAMDYFWDVLRLKDPGIGRPYPLFDHTLRALFDMAVFDLVRDWIVEVLDYETVCVAVIIYARTQGVSIDKADIRALQEALQRGDLTPMAIRALERFSAGMGDSRDLLAVLREKFPVSASAAQGRREPY